jgi:hypothetical protein
VIAQKKGGNKYVGTRLSSNTRPPEKVNPVYDGIIARTAEGRLIPMPQVTITKRPSRTKGTV